LALVLRVVRTKASRYRCTWCPTETAFSLPPHTRLDRIKPAAPAHRRATELFPAIWTKRKEKSKLATTPPEILHPQSLARIMQNHLGEIPMLREAGNENMARTPK